MLCPKGLSEHHTIARRQPRALPAAAQHGERFDARSAGTRRSRRWRRSSATCRRATARARSASSAPGSSSPRSSTRSASWCSSGSARRNYDGNTTLCMSTAVAGYKRSFGSDGPPGAYEDLETRRRHPAHRREHRRQPSDPLPAARSQSRHDAHRRRSARDQDGDDGRPAPADPAAVGPRAAQRPDSHRHRARPRRSRLHRAPHDRLRRAARVGARATRRSASRRSPASRRS